MTSDQHEQFDAGELSSSLYPKARTYEQERELQLAILERQRQQRPRWTLISVAIIVAIIFTFSLDITNILTATVQFATPMGGVFFAFLLCMLAFGLLAWQRKRVMTYFAAYGLSSGWFIWFYIFTTGMAAWLYITYLAHPGDLTDRILLTTLHAIAMAACGMLYARYRGA